MNRNRVSEALARAIRGFISTEEIFDTQSIETMAQEYVYEHDAEIREALRECVDWESIFELALDDAIQEAIEQYEPW